MLAGLAGKDACATSTAGTGFLDEFIEEGVLAVVSGPDSEVAAPGDPALGSFPKKAGIGMLGKLVETDITSVNGHGLGIGRESDDARTVIEFDHADSDFIGKGSETAIGVEARDFEIILAVFKNGPSKVEKTGEAFAEPYVLEGGWKIPGGKEVIALFEAEAFADIFEGVGERPADAD